MVQLQLPLAANAKRTRHGSLRAGDINAFLDVSRCSTASTPLASTAAVRGFPIPADDHLDWPLDVNEPLVKNSAAFAVRISGESMRDRGMLPGDIAVADRSRSAVSNCVVISLVGSNS